jgi:exodeoxyribonuclease VIII
MQQYRQMHGLSKHELDKFVVSPSYYEWSKSQEFKPSRNMEIGTLIHSLVLERNVDYAVGPKVDRRTTAGKLEWAEFCAENLNKMIVTEEEAAVIKGCDDACMPLVNTIMFDRKLDVECSMFWNRQGVECKGRPDLIGYVNGEYSIVDLKTTNDIMSFDRSFWNFRYNMQAAWYRHALQKETSEKVSFYFLVVDTNAPHLVQFVKPSDKLLDAADIQIDRDLEQFKKCLETGFEAGLPAFREITIK